MYYFQRIHWIFCTSMLACVHVFQACSLVCTVIRCSAAQVPRALPILWGDPVRATSLGGGQPKPGGHNRSHLGCEQINHQSRPCVINLVWCRNMSWSTKQRFSLWNNFTQSTIISISPVYVLTRNGQHLKKTKHALSFPWQTTDVCLSKTCLWSLTMSISECWQTNHYLST